MFDRAFSAVFRNFSTLFLIALVVAAPLHLAHAVAFQRVISVAELHPEIETFPEERQVKSVGRTQLSSYRKSYGGVLLLELALLPLMAGAARRTFRDEEEGAVPTATRSWRKAPGEVGGLFKALASALPVLLAGFASALLIGFLAERVGLLVSEFFGDDTRYIAVGLAHALAHSVALPLLFGAWGASHPVTGTRLSNPEPLDLY